MDYENICVVGDFNAIIDTKLDYKSSKESKKVRRTLPVTFFKMTEEICTQDTWREINPEKNQYTLYSSRHQSWSRIYMIWMSLELSTNVEEIEIEMNMWLIIIQ
uniref:Endonuclease/exonuclease/phosphatase domain-containing protein n=1 Tax=Micrurus corallinus TaxID=54390 RepID=A0A2D4FDT2_MICCO